MIVTAVPVLGPARRRSARSSAPPRWRPHAPARGRRTAGRARRRGRARCTACVPELVNDSSSARQPISAATPPWPAPAATWPAGPRGAAGPGLPSRQRGRSAAPPADSGAAARPEAASKYTTVTTLDVRRARAAALVPVASPGPPGRRGKARSRTGGTPGCGSAALYCFPRQAVGRRP